MKKAIAIAAVLYFGIALYGEANKPTDDTDPPRTRRFFPERSGLELFNDHLTGCQYLRAGSTFGGAVTPRLDANGSPMCGVGCTTDSECEGVRHE